MSRRTTAKTGVASVAAGSLLALSACGGGGADGANAWILTGGSWPVVQDDFDRWNEENSDEQISVETFENDAYKERIRTVVGSGEAPTLIMSWTGGALLDYVEGERIVDISEQTGELRERVHESVWQNGEVDGSVYAVPMNDVQPVVLYYNQGLFDEAGLEIPQTWSEVEEAVEVFNDQDITPFSLAGGSVWPALMWLQYLTDRHGGEDAFASVMEGEENSWGNESILYALETIQWLVDNDGFDEAFASVSADQNEDARLLADGEAAMLLQGSWVYATIQEDFPDFADSDDFGFAEFPQLEDGQGDPSNIVGNPANFWSVSADAAEEDQETAINYIADHLYNEETVETMLSQGSLPPLEGIEEQIAESDDADFLEFANQIVSEANHFQLSWDQAVAPNQEQALMENLENILLGSITPEEFADNMNALQE